MKNLMKILTLALTGMLILGTISGCTTESDVEPTEDETVETTPTMTDGTYTSEVVGHNAPLTLDVTVTDGKVDTISVDHLETIGLGARVITEYVERVIAEQSIGFDTITGSTITSYAMLKGLEDALTQAGADMEAWKTSVEVKETEDEVLNTDVVVIGAGGAGLASAIKAEQTGAQVIVVEQLGLPGGSTNVSEGALNAVDDVRQPKQGIEDSIENFYTQTIEGGRGTGTPEMVQTMVDNAYGAVVWMEDLGVEFKEEVGTATGALFQRSHYPTTPSGNSYIRVFEEYVNNSNGNISIEYNTTATKILVDENGSAVGVEATNNGRTVTVNAKSVIVATGGFGANVDLRQEVNTGVWSEVSLDSSIGTTNLTPAAQGTGIDLGAAAGADVVGMSDIQLHPCGTPGTGLMVDIRTSGRNRLFLNNSGSRFVNEGAARDTLVKAVFEQEDAGYWILVNAVRYPDRTTPDANGSTIENMVALGAVVEADTLEELAEKTGMDLENLTASIEQYNEVVRGEVEKDEFGFAADNEADVELIDGPWYACAKVPTVHHTMGGLKINTNAEVLDVDGNTISGLYAAGEVTGGIHGSNRLGGNAITDCMVFGQIAGENAANNAVVDGK